MIIDSGLLTGSLSVSGSYTQTGDATISGSLTVTGTINATISGSATSASYATTASYVSPNTQINSASFAITASYARNVDFNNTVATSSYAITASYVSPTTQINTASYAVTAAYARTVDFNNTVATSSFAVTASYVSPTTQINTASFAFTSSYASNAELLDGYDSSVFVQTGSFNTVSSSLASRIASQEAFSSSLDATFATDAQLASATASLSSSLAQPIASLTTYTGSTDAKIASIYSTTSSLNASIASLNSYTSSNAMNIASLFATSASLNANVAGLNAQTASLLSYTSSNNTTNNTQNTRLGALEAYTASNDTTNTTQNTRLGALEAATASLYTTTSSLNASVTSLNTYTSSLNAKTASFATTGSNTFTGRQYISEASQATSFTSTASLYTDGGFRVTKDAYVSGTLYLNNLTVFGTQSISYISSSQLNISTNLITVNTETPSIRFGGLAVYDSGSTGLTGSILWDSQENHWVYTNPSGSSYSGGMFISGPRASSLGSEQGTTNNALMKGQGGDHITSSGIFESGSNGNVGIGTTTPGAKLDISSTGVILRLGDNGDSTTNFDFSRNQQTGALTIQGNQTGDNNIVLAPTSGNVGIGITTPTVRLHVSGTTGGVFEVDGASAVNALYVSASGQVGIGTTSPTAPLEVLGTSGDGTPTFKVTSTAAGNSFNWAGTILNSALGSSRNYLLIIGQAASTKNSGYIGYNHSGTGGSNSNYLTFGHFGSDNLVNINGVGNVGIGTTSPADKLDVIGNIRVSSTNFFRYDGDTGLIGSGTSITGGTSTQLGIRAASDILFATNGANERMRITSGGNVGVGTTSPGARLDVSDGSSYFYIRGNASGDFQAPALAPHMATGDFTIYAGAIGSGTARVTVLNAGNVGIGTTSPAQRLDVRGFIVSNSQNNGSESAFYLGNASHGLSRGNVSNTINLYTTSGDIRLSTNNNGTVHLIVASDGNVGIGTTSPTARLHVSGADAILRNAYIGEVSGYGANYTQFSHISRSGTAAYSFLSGNAGDTYINSSGSNYIFFRNNNNNLAVISADGNVGIGTTSPSQKLTVVENGFGLRIQQSTDSTQYILVSGNQMQAYQSGGGGTLYLNYSANGNIITGTGNVGIGTSSPGNKLTIYDTNSTVHFAISNPTAGSISQIGFIGDTKSAYIFKGNSTYSSYGGANSFNLYTDTSGGPISFHPGATTNAVTFATSGNVGIGTTSPGAKLEVVYSGGYDDGISVKSTSGYAVLTMDASANSYPILEFKENGAQKWQLYNEPTDDSFNIYTFPSSSIRLTILANGNVGIGTTSPATRLDVKGDARIQGGGDVNYAVFNLLDNTSGGSNWAIASGFPSIGDFTIRESGVENWLVIKKTTGNALFAGNVGIGTTSPASLLQVGGSGASPSSSPTAIQLDNSYRNAVGGNTSLKFYLYRSSNETYGIGLNNAGGIEYHSGAANDNSSYQAFYFGNSEKIRFKGDGNVGIGTTSPSNHLTIGQNTAGDETAYSLAILRSGTSSSPGTWMSTPAINITDVSGDGPSSASNALLQLNLPRIADADTYSNNAFFINCVNDNGSAFVVTGQRNVGIGTTSPGALLHIQRSTVSYGQFRITSTSNNTGEASINFGRTDQAIDNRWTVGQGVASIGDSFGFYTGGDARIVFNTSGNVGIGTTTPTLGKLQSTGDNNQIAVHTTGTYSSIYFYNGGSDKAGIYVSNTETHFEGRGSSGLFFGGAVSQNHMTIAANGNVGIGTTSPAAKLDVAGNGRFISTASYVLEINQNIANSDFNDAIFIANTQSGQRVQFGMATTDADGQHHRVSLRAYKGSGLYEGVFGIVMRQASSGNHTQRLTLSAAGTLTVDGDVVAFSDARLKENITTIDNAVEKVLAMRGVSYNRTDESDKSRKVGVIAQEIQEILPEVVTTSEDGTLGVAYGNIVGVLIEAIKEQQQQIDELKYLLQTINK
jgi:hypothetical protein